MSDVVYRIETVLELDGSSTTSFARRAGIDPGNLAKMLAGKQTITDGTLRKLSDAYGVSFEWLKYGEGEMYEPKTAPETSTGQKGVPFYQDLPVSAGELDALIQNAAPSGYVDVPGINAKALFPVVGCSMQPEINPGDVVGISPIELGDIVDPDKTYLIITHNDRMIKHLAMDAEDDSILWCVSPNYPKFKIRKEDIKFVYRVTFCGKIL